MRFKEVLKDAYLIEVEPCRDNRGFFARSFCRKEFAALGLKAEIVQCNFSYNSRKGTFRGMHYQAPPFEEAKIVNCVKGSVYDVIVDLRTSSPNYREWAAVELSERSMTGLYVPEGFAHGFLTLEDDSTILYQMTGFYNPESGRGFRWDDPAFGIRLPDVGQLIISEKDRSYGDYLIGR